MKLHDLVTDPTKLKTYGKYISAEDAYESIRAGDQDPRFDDIIVKDPEYAYYYARDVIKGRFSDGEPAIAKILEYDRWYNHFLKGNKAITS